MSVAAHILSAEPKPFVDPDEYGIEVDFDVPLKRMIAAGRYDWTDRRVERCNFTPLMSGTKLFRHRLFRFSESMWSEDVISALSAEGFEPGTHVHGLALGATVPEKQTESAFLCLGSSAYLRGHRFIAWLYEVGDGRCLGLIQWERIWYPGWRFLGVQEVSGRGSFLK